MANTPTPTPPVLTMPPPDQQPQATAATPPPPPQGLSSDKPMSFKQGFQAGAGGQHYVVDQSGNVVPVAPAAQPSARGEFGKILAGAALGALQGASVARPGGIPSHDLRGGFGAGAQASEQYFENRDLRARAQAQQNFANTQSVKKLNQEEALQAAEIAKASAETQHAINQTKFEQEEHPYLVNQLKLKNQEAVDMHRKFTDDYTKNQLEFVQTLADNGIDPALWAKSYGQAQQYMQNNPLGTDTYAAWNGEHGEGQAAALFDVADLDKPLLKDAVYRTYTVDKKGNPVAHENTIPAGQPARQYVLAAMAGQGQLRQINSQQKIESEAAYKNLQAQNEIMNMKKSQAELARLPLEQQKDQLELEKLAEETKQLKAVGDLTKTGADYLATLPPEQQGLVTAIGTGHVVPDRLGILLGKSPALLESVTHAYPDFDTSKATSYSKTYNAFTSGKEGQQLTNGATALQHLSELWDMNTRESLVPGTNDHTAYNSKANQVAEELTSFYGDKTIPAIEAQMKNLNSILPGNREAAIKTAVQSMSDRLSEMENQWKGAAPSPAYEAPLPHFSMEAAKARARFDPAYAQSDDFKRIAGAHTPAVGDTQTYNGATYVFDGKQYVKK